MESLSEHLELLNSEQLEAVIHSDSPLLILAGAGSGKTRVITTKIAYLINKKNVEPWKILSVTFTKKAANEMRERAIQIEPRAAECQIRTFHSFGSWFLRRYAEEAGVEPSFTVYDDSDMITLIKNACPHLNSKDTKLAAHQISLCKDYCLTPDDDLSPIGSDLDLCEIYREYEKRLRATGNVDFGDLIMLPVLLMEKNREIADFIHNRFKVIMVDEYQDSNIAQYKLLQALSGVNEGTGTYVCVVGDDDQSIYKFRGAEVQNILSFPDHFPGTTIIRLEQNYRSTSKILDAASHVVKNNRNRLGKNLIAARGDGAKPVLAFLGDQNAEATFCGDLISKSVGGGNSKYSDWAVLYRTNNQSLGFEKEFLHRQIPYVVVGSLKFYEREEIKDTLAYLSLCANPKDEISFRRVINKPARGLGEKTQNKILDGALLLHTDGTTSYMNLLEACEKSKPTLTKKAAEGVEEFSKLFSQCLQKLSGTNNEGKSLSDFIDYVVQESGLEEFHKESDEIEGTQRVQNLQELANSAVPYEYSVQGLLDFLDAINLDRSLELSDGEVSDNAVTLITLHNTKGLEYKKVIITGLEEGVFPRIDKTGMEMEEERRLFYVGITRAMDELYVTSTARRCLYGSWQLMRPSPFIREAAEGFTVIGQAPLGFGGSSSFGSRGWKSANSEISDDSIVDPELVEKWKKGVKIYHDDYGYGMIVSQKITDTELVVEIQFETGTKKKFLPAYQSKALTIIKD